MTARPLTASWPATGLRSAGTEFQPPRHLTSLYIRISKAPQTEPGKMIFHYCQRTTASGDCRLRPAGPNGVGLEMGYLVRLQGFTSQNETRRSNSLVPAWENGHWRE